ncbi:hypothetical protein JCM10207_002419 [Rhodosporidiobolus poonsookiae]
MLPALPLELLLYIATVCAPPPQLHRARKAYLSACSLVHSSWRKAAQSELLSSVRYVLSIRDYAHATSRHWRAANLSADASKQRPLVDRLRWLQARGVAVMELEISSLLLILPDRLREGDELRELLVRAGVDVRELTVSCDPEGAARLQDILALFPNVKHLTIQAEALSDRVALPFSPSAAPSSPSESPSAPPLPTSPPTGFFPPHLTHLTIWYFTLDQWPAPAQLPSLPSLRVLNLRRGGFARHQRLNLSSFLALTPNLHTLILRSFHPELGRASLVGAPQSLKRVVVQVEAELRAKDIWRAVRGFPGRLDEVRIEARGSWQMDGDEDRAYYEDALEQWCERRGIWYDQGCWSDLAEEEEHEGRDDGEEDVRLL